MNRIKRKLRNNAIQKQNEKELEKIKQSAENSALKIEKLLNERKMYEDKIDRSFQQQQQQQEEPVEDQQKKRREEKEKKIAELRIQNNKKAKEAIEKLKIRRENFQKEIKEQRMKSIEVQRKVPLYKKKEEQFNMQEEFRAKKAKFEKLKKLKFSYSELKRHQMKMDRIKQERSERQSSITIKISHKKSLSANPKTNNSYSLHLSKIKEFAQKRKEYGNSFIQNDRKPDLRPFITKKEKQKFEIFQKIKKNKKRAHLYLEESKQHNIKTSNPTLYEKIQQRQQRQSIELPEMEIKSENQKEKISKSDSKLQGKYHLGKKVNRVRYTSHNSYSNCLTQEEHKIEKQHQLNKVQNIPFLQKIQNQKDIDQNFMSLLDQKLSLIDKMGNNI